jgi:hypothetical protein
MMEGYLGEEVVEDLTGTEFEGMDIPMWVSHWVINYGQYDGHQHKSWVLDQILQIAHGTKVVVSLAKWEDGLTEYRCTLAEPSRAYLRTVRRLCSGEDHYEAGSPP